MREKKKKKTKNSSMSFLFYYYTAITECTRWYTKKYDEKRSAASVQSTKNKIIFIRCILPPFPFPGSVEKCLDFIALLSCYCCCCGCCCCCYFFWCVRRCQTMISHVCTLYIYHCLSVPVDIFQAAHTHQIHKQTHFVTHTATEWNYKPKDRKFSRITYLCCYTVILLTSI